MISINFDYSRSTFKTVKKNRNLIAEHGNYAVNNFAIGLLHWLDEKRIREHFTVNHVADVERRGN